MPKLQKILIFCPDISGHRHLYCKRLIEYFIDREIEFVVATAGRCVSVSRTGGYKYATFADHSAEQLRKQHSDVYVDILDEASKSWSELAVAARVAKRVGATDILHVDADSFRFDFALGLHRKLLAPFRNHLIVLNTEFSDFAQYHVSRSGEFCNFSKRIFRPFSMISILRNRVAMCEIFPRLTKFITRRISANAAVTSVIHCDERFESFFGDKSLHVPEIGVSFWSRLEKGGDELPPFEARLFNQIKDFLQERAELRPVLFFGDVESRKGYDLLLRLSAAETDTVIVRVGRTKPTYRNSWESIQAREKLMREDRILEFDTYVDAALFYRALQMAPLAIIAYVEFYRTSAYFIDCLFAKMPIIAPEAGLIGFTVNKHKLGRTYRGGDLDSLIKSYREMITEFSSVDPHLESYAKKLTKSSIYSSWDQVFLKN